MVWRRLAPLIVAGALALAVTACGGDDDSAVQSAAGGGSGEPTGTLRLGYFPNLTHAPALYGVDRGIFADKLGPGVKLETATFNSGTTASEALLSGALDIAYIGPNPAVNTFVKSKGEAIRIISGVASGGAALVVKKEITTVEQLRGATIATPSKGNTQDVAARYFLKEKGLTTTLDGGGDVEIRPQENSITVDAFKSGAIDGAWVPEPVASRLVAEGGHVLVDEATLWPGGAFVTTHLIVRTAYLKKNPAIVKRFLEANLAAVDALNADPAEGRKATNAAYAKLTGKPLADDVAAAAWKNLAFTADPIASSLFTSAGHATDVGLLKAPKLEGIYDLALLNEVLSAAGKPAVADK
jgi:NitT/TauT family transport system substrate-binding protein